MSVSRGLRRFPKSYAVSNVVGKPQIPPHQVVYRLASNGSSITRYQSRLDCRSLTTSSCRGAEKPRSQQDGAREEDTFDLGLEEEMLAMQNKAIADLEAKLGKSLERAVVEDRLAEHLGLDDVEEGIEEEDVAENGQEEITTDPLQSMRDQGSSSTDIVTAARNTFGDYLPHDALTDEEFILYKRLYGEPLEPELEVDEEIDGQENDSLPQNALFNADGQQVEYALEDEIAITEDMLQQAKMNSQSDAHVRQDSPPADLYEAARAEQIAQSLGGSVMEDHEEYDYDEEDEEDPMDKAHPLTTLGRMRTFPRTTFMPSETFVKPVQEMLRDASNKHLRETAIRTFGGPTLPDSAMTPLGSRSRKQVPIALEAGQRSMGIMEANVFVSTVMPPVYASVQSTLVETRRRLGSSWLNKLLAKEGGPRILDAGSGGAAALAWNDTIKAHWETLHSSDKSPPPVPASKMVVLTGSDALRHQSMKLMDNTTFVPRLPDLTSTRDRPTLDDDREPQTRKQFDVIISTHSLFPLKEEFERKQYIQKMWSLLAEDGGVLIMIEKGIPRGFETIAAARDLLLDKYIATPEEQSNYYSETSEHDASTKSPGMIIAPCTNHEQCPLYTVGGLSKGRRDICSFSQRYIRPPFLQNILQARDRNHDDVHYSYISVLKGDDLRTRTFNNWDHSLDPLSAPKAQNVYHAANQQEAGNFIEIGFEEYDPAWASSRPPPPQHLLARVMKAPMKRRGHVILDVCTPQAQIRRWTIPKSFSRQAYRDARKSRWGDLWALGTKVNIKRNLSLGSPLKDVQIEKALSAEGVKTAKPLKPLTRAERLEMRNGQKAEKKQIQAEEDEEAREEALLQQLIEEDDLLDAEDGDDDFADMERERLPSNKRKVNHAKLEGVNLVSSKKKTDKKTRTPKSEQRMASDRQRRLHPKMMDMQEFGTTRSMDVDRLGTSDPLNEWADDLDAKFLEDQARRGVAKTGRRPSAKNTFRFKRDLRRARRQFGSDGDANV